MSSIRPLVTITILVAVGVFMFTKINEGPAPLPPEMDSSLEQAPAIDIPPLASETVPTPLPSAPGWNDPSAVTTPLPPATPPTTLTADSSASAPPQPLNSGPADLPPIPELPPVATAEAIAPPAAATPTNTSAPPIPLPTNIPVAQYPADASSPAPAGEPMSPPAPLTTQPLAPSTGQAPLPPAADAAAQVAPPTPAALADDRYGAIPAAEPTTAAATIPAAPPAASEVPAAPAEPAAPTFASAWPEIQGALQRQELVAAHAMLSRWYGNPTLTPAETQQIETLLSQLAGTIVYSTEHRLEPPYTVKPGDTLQTIAQQYEVPWQLLAKINGIADPNGVPVGQQLKVIHGPFAAIVELDKSQLTLMLDGRYAGRFPLSLVEGATVSEGEWVLEQKLAQPTTQNSVGSAAYAPSAVEQVLVLRSETATAPSATISITGGQSTPSGPAPGAPAAIRLSPRDVEEVADILSIGSPVTIRR